MIDETKLPFLIEAVTRIIDGHPERAEHFRQNLMKENVPLCGMKADELPYYDPRSERA